MPERKSIFGVRLIDGRAIRLKERFAEVLAVLARNHSATPQSKEGEHARVVCAGNIDGLSSTCNVALLKVEHGFYDVCCSGVNDLYGD